MASQLEVGVLAAQLCAPVPGGTGRYTAELIGALARARPVGAALEATVARRCAASASLPVAVRSLGVPYPVLARLWERGLPPRVPAAVVHAPTLLVPPRSRGGGLVVTIHDAVPWTHPETLTPRGVSFHRRMAARAAETADVIATPTEAVARQLREILAPRGQVLSIPPGPSTLSVPPQAEAIRQATGVVGPYILFVGTAEPRKGLDVLIPAMSRPGLRRHQLVVVGPQGWGSVSVDDLARAAGVSSRVVMAGQVTDTVLGALFAGAAALAVPSRAEGFGLPLLEAMVLGVPVVTSADPALVEVGGGAALVTDSLDPDSLAASLEEATADEETRGRLGEAGRKRAMAFSWDRSAADLWSLYARLSATAYED